MKAKKIAEKSLIKKPNRNFTKGRHMRVRGGENSCTPRKNIYYDIYRFKKISNIF